MMINDDEWWLMMYIYIWILGYIHHMYTSLIIICIYIYIPIGSIYAIYGAWIPSIYPIYVSILYQHHGSYGLLMCFWWFFGRFRRCWANPWARGIGSFLRGVPLTLGGSHLRFFALGASWSLSLNTTAKPSNLACFGPSKTIRNHPIQCFGP